MLSDHSIFLHYRHDMSRAEDPYWQEPLVRTLQTMKDHANNQKFSCVHKPLLEIPLENVILDELHLMLRVTGMCRCKIMNCFGLFLGEIEGKTFTF